MKQQTLAVVVNPHHVARWVGTVEITNPPATIGSRERIAGRQVLLRLLKLELRFISFKEIAEFLRRIEQAHPLLVVERYGETAKTVETNAALLAHFKLQTASALLLFKFCDPRLQFVIRWFGHMCCSFQGNTLSIFRMIRSAH